MKRNIKFLFSLFLSLAMVCSFCLSTTVFAEDTDLDGDEETEVVENTEDSVNDDDQNQVIVDDNDALDESDESGIETFALEPDDSDESDNEGIETFAAEADNLDETDDSGIQTYAEGRNPDYEYFNIVYFIEWDDDNNANNTRPEEWNFNITKDDVVEYSYTMTQANAWGENYWWCFIPDFCDHDSDGNYVRWVIQDFYSDGDYVLHNNSSWSEDNGDGTSTSVHYVTIKYEPSETNDELKYTNVHVRTLWDDLFNEYNTRPDSITYTFTSSIGETTTRVQTSADVDADFDNIWETVYSDFLRSNEGKAIEYNIVVPEVEGYTYAVYGNYTLGFNVTYYYEGDEITATTTNSGSSASTSSTGSSTADSDKTNDSVVKTDDTGNAAIYALLGAVALFGIGALSYTKKKESL